MRLFVVMAASVLLSACALPVRQLPLGQPLVPATGRSFVLSRDVRCYVGTGYGRTLRAGTHWNLFGRLRRGAVYRSPDEVLTVEGYDVHEAYLVVRDGVLVGFYLPVEKTFTPISKAVTLAITSP
jgi:hypothetical protein